MTTATAHTAHTAHKLIIRGKVKEGFDTIQKVGHIKMLCWFNAADSNGKMAHEIDGQRYVITVTEASNATLDLIEAAIAEKHPKVKTERVAA